MELMPFQKMREILEALKAEPVWSQLFEFLADQVDHIVWLADQDSNLLYINDYWVELTGVSKEGALEREEWRQCIQPLEVEMIFDIGEHVRTTEEIQDVKYHLLDIRTGIPHLVSGHIFPFKDNSGKVSFWMGIVQKV